MGLGNCGGEHVHYGYHHFEPGKMNADTLATQAPALPFSRRDSPGARECRRAGRRPSAPGCRHIEPMRKSANEIFHDYTCFLWSGNSARNVRAQIVQNVLHALKRSASAWVSLLHS